MMRFVKRRLLPYLVGLTESRWSYKTLAEATSTSGPVAVCEGADTPHALASLPS